MMDQETPSLREKLIEERVAATGIDEATVERLVHAFYDKVRVDPVLGPVFARSIAARSNGDWGPHLRTMVDFWSSVALMTARYHGRPMPVHIMLGIGAEHFGRWLDLFRETAGEICTPEGAAFFIGKAENIARSFQMGIEAFTVKLPERRRAPT